MQLKSMLSIVLFTWLAAGCAAPMSDSEFPQTGDNTKSFSFVNYGWHSALVIRKVDIPVGILPEINDFPDAEYLEFGWGDRDYYQAADPGIFLTLKAVFFSGGSVLHVAGFNGPVASIFRHAEIIEIGTSAEAFQELVTFISRSFSRSGAFHAKARPGLYASSRFYPATGRFHLFRTCNTWVASALNAAGLPVHPSFSVTAGSLSRQVQPLALPSRLR